MSEWISVADRLPEGKEDVLCVAFWHESWQTMVGWYSDLVGEGRIITPVGEKMPGGVAFWMPLPELPKEAQACSK